MQLARRELPGLVRLHALAGPAGRPAGLVEEHVAGGSLEQRVRADGPLDPGAAAALLRGAAAGLAVVEPLSGELGDYHPFHVARAELLRRAGRTQEARTAYDRAVELAGNPAERAHLAGRRDELDG